MTKRFILASTFFLFLGLIFFLPPRLINILKIECSSQYGECPSEIKSKVEAVNSKNLVNTKKELKNILKDNFLVSDFSTQFKFPSTLRVNLVVKKAVFAITQVGTNNYLLVDVDGWVVGITDASSLPTLKVSDKLKNVGENVGEPYLFPLNIMGGVFNMYQAQIGEIKDGSLLVELPSSLKVRFPLSGDVDYYLGALRLIVSKIETESPGKYREIDLRFKNPVLR